MKDESSPGLIHPKGFTLIELMAAIAIVGILASIAIPIYDKFKRRARQAEGKVMLSSGYVIEASIRNAENGGSYTACLQSLGLKAEGLPLYSVGFNDTAGTLTGCTPMAQPAAVGTAGTRISGCDAFSWSKDTAGNFTIAAVCVAPSFSVLSTLQATPTSAAPATATDLSTTVSWSNFEIIAAGSIGGASLDKWGTNESKLVYQLQDGVN